MRRTGVLAGLVLATALQASEPAMVLTPAVAGGWSVALGCRELVAGAGSDWPALLESGVAETLDLEGLGNLSWELSVKRLDLNWDTDLRLEVGVVGAGAGTGTVVVPRQYLVVTDTFQPLVTGQGDRNHLTLALRLGGVSVATVGHLDLATRLVYTLRTWP